jgi:mannose-6-phosphate isomerase-like protein (cupin superfamily)
MDDDPFARPLRPQDIPETRSLFSKKNLQKAEFCSSTGLLAQRILTNIYEQDLMFLPTGPLNWDKYQLFYSDELRKNGEYIRSDLEKLVFGFLNREIEVSEGWTLSALKQYCEGVINDVAGSPSTLARIIAQSVNPQAAAKFFIIQCASDFLSEASAMARNCLGAYGPHLSELFKILIDEYGYGVHKTKHSQAFVDLMESIGLNPSVHYYWQFYTASSLGIVNYFHYLCKNHGNFFKYLGALYYTEATLAHVTQHQTKILKSTFGDSVNTYYFEEHTHIDGHHGRMAMDNIIKPIVEQYGNSVIPHIAAGFEEFRLVQELADHDLYRQIEYNTNLNHWKEVGTKYWRENLKQLPDGILLSEPKDELSVPHCHDADELLVVLDGALEFIANPVCPIQLHAGEAIMIPKYLHHGSLIKSDACTYKVIDISNM